MGSFVNRAIELRDSSVGGGSVGLDLLGRLLIMARVGCRLDQKDVSDEAHITTTTISKIERGEVLPNPRTVRDMILFYELRGVVFYDAERAVAVPGGIGEVIR